MPIWKVRRSRLPVDDVNSEFADAIACSTWSRAWSAGGWRISEYVRSDNLTDRNYVGSVIVNEGNRRFYEPAPRRSVTVGVQASLQF